MGMYLLDCCVESFNFCCFSLDECRDDGRGNLSVTDNASLSQSHRWDEDISLSGMYLPNLIDGLILFTTHWCRWPQERQVAYQAGDHTHHSSA